MKISKRKLGREIEISPIGMGCMGLSHGYGKIPERDYSINAIRTAHDFGCNFFDTAEVYGAQLYYEGHNEEILGEAVEPFRKDVVLATKLHIADSEVGSGDALYKVLKNHLERSLKRLRTDYLDLYYLHRTRADVSIEDIAVSMGKLINEGLIRSWGLSAVSVETLSCAHKIEPVAAVQNIYSMLERDAEKEIFPFCTENQITVVPFSPIASGLLSGKVTADTQFEKVDDVRVWVPQLSKENIEGNKPIVEMLQKFAAQKNATPAQISLAWMLHKYPNVVPIPGSKNRERILENLGAWDVDLSGEEFSDLEKALSACKIYGHRGQVEQQGTVHKKHS